MSANTSEPLIEAKPTELASKFDGGGVQYPAKYLGSCVVLDGQSQLLCQEAMQKLLTALKRRKEPKERLKVTLSLDGIRLVESAGDEKQPPQLDLLLRHCEVSYVFKEPKDQRSCGLVRTEADPENAGKKINKFYGIRTLKSASPLLQDLRQLFQLVKERQEKGLAEVTEGPADTVDGADKQGEAPAKDSPQLTDPATAVTPKPVAVTGGAAEPHDPMAAAPATEVAHVTDSQGATLLTRAGMAAPVPAFAPASLPKTVPVIVPEIVPDRAADLMDMNQPDKKPVGQSMASSSVGSLDELSELFSSQASLASSGGGGGGPTAVSFNPWAMQPPQHPVYQHQQVLALQQQQQQQQQQALLHPPSYMMLNRQLSHPHSIVACDREPARKSSHPSMLFESSQVAQAAAVYHENKRPSDPGLLQGSLPLEYLQQQYYHQQQQQQALLQQMQYAQYQQMHHAQNPQTLFGPGAYGPAVYATPGFTPMQPMSPYQMPPQPLWQPPGPQPQQQQQQQPPPLLPPTSSTQLIEGDFVSVFDQQQREASEVAKKPS